MVAVRDIEAGEPLLLDYGKLSNDFFLMVRVAYDKLSNDFFLMVGVDGDSAVVVIPYVTAGVRRLPLHRKQHDTVHTCTYVPTHTGLRFYYGEQPL